MGGPTAREELARLGRLFCPHNDPDCACVGNCVSSIYGTPSNPENHAKMIRKRVDMCTGEPRRPDATQHE